MPSYLRLCVLVCLPLVTGCGGCRKETPTGDQAIGENTQLRDRQTASDTRVKQLELELNTLREQNTRLTAQLAAATNGSTLSLEELQKHLDTRKAALDKREQDLIARETTVESQIGQRRQELQKEYASREQDVLKREQSITAKEAEFHKATNLTMKDVGEAQFVKKEYEAMRSARDEANAKAEKWLTFIWWVSIAFAIAFMICVVLAIVSYLKHLAAMRELKIRQEVAKLLGTALTAQLPPEQGALVVKAFHQLTQGDDQSRPTGPGEPSADS